MYLVIAIWLVQYTLVNEVKFFMKKFLTLSASLVLCFAFTCRAEKLSFTEDTNFAIDYESSQLSQIPILVDDEVNSLKMMKNEVETWQRKDEYFNQWNLEGTGIYQNTEQNKEQIIIRSFTRYAERRVQDFFRKKKKGDKAAKAESYILKNINKGIAEEENRYRLKWSSTPTRGRIRLTLENPFVELYGQYALGSRDELGIIRMFKDIKVKLSLLHAPLQSKTTFVSEKFITENLVAKYSNLNFVENKYEVLYSYSF